MSSLFKPAQRSQAKLRLALTGPSGSGKTYSALQIAFGLGGKVAVVDTERGSASLYSHLGKFDTAEMSPPFAPGKYVRAIKEAEQAGYNVIIIDSLSHAWVGPGGILDIHDRASAKEKNTWAAWRHVTPQHNALLDAILQCNLHVIVTLRSKQEYASVEAGGKRRVQKVGLAPVQREGVEYEFTLVLDLDANHTAMASKDRTSLFDGQMFIPDKGTGKALLDWLSEGEQGESQTTAPKANSEPPVAPTKPAGSEKPAESESKTEESSKPKPKPWTGEVVILGNPVKRGRTVEVQAVDREDEASLTLFGVVCADLNEGLVVRIDKGLRRDNRVKVEAFTINTEFSVPAKDPADNDSGQSEDAVEMNVRVTIDSAPVTGRKTFDGAVKNIVWCYAISESEKIVVAGMDDMKDVVANFTVGEAYNLSGVSKEANNNIIFYISRVEAAA